MKTQPIDQFACTLPPEKRKAVYESTKATHEKRTKLLAGNFADPDRLRRLAGEVKQHVIENLDTLLPQVEERLTAGGAQVHWAADAEAARRHVLAICSAAAPRAWSRRRPW